MEVLNLIREFELQKMKEFEIVKEYLDRLLGIVNKAQEQRRLLRQDGMVEIALAANHKTQSKVFFYQDLVLRLDVFRKLKKHRGWVNAVSFSVDGDILISNSNEIRSIVTCSADGQGLDPTPVSPVLYDSFGEKTNTDNGTDFVPQVYIVLASSGVESDIKIWSPKAINRVVLPTNIEKVELRLVPRDPGCAIDFQSVSGPGGTRTGDLKDFVFRPLPVELPLMSGTGTLKSLSHLTPAVICEEDDSGELIGKKIISYGGNWNIVMLLYLRNHKIFELFYVNLSINSPFKKAISHLFDRFQDHIPQLMQPTPEWMLSLLLASVCPTSIVYLRSYGPIIDGAGVPLILASSPQFPLGYFFHQEFSKSKMEKFVNLREERISVKEYTLKFHQLSRYAPDLADDN
ncbi:hypothetical protein FXO38_29448 [Capsicum annuum]|nr:hypothetical protein FXO38_29448 [Capsicum annuum]